MKNNGWKRTGWTILWRVLWTLAVAAVWVSSWLEAWVVLAAFKARPPANDADEPQNIVTLRRG